MPNAAMRQTIHPGVWERENLLVTQNTLREKGSKIQMVKAYEGSPTATSDIDRDW